PAPDPAARAAAAAALTTARRRGAWPVHRWPAEKRVLPAKARIHLPRTYMGEGAAGEDVRVVWPGTDLNVFVFRHYEELVDAARAAAEGWVNYVTADRVVARRHEYLGPDPRVAGYWYDVTGEIHIYWLDGFLGDQWVDKTKWSTMQVVMDEKGNWVEKD
ncbi:hypothetical protein DENSPDRAFT_757803, partial [Dentipellis sp. KUC8613]